MPIWRYNDWWGYVPLLDKQHSLPFFQLQDAQWDANRAGMGIVYIDEIDKIARRSGSGADSSRDVSGEGVQQALLRMLEGSVVSVQGKGGGSSEMYSPPSSSDGPGRSRQRQHTQRQDTYHIDTSNVLFILSGAFVGLDNIIKQRVSKPGVSAYIISMRRLGLRLVSVGYRLYERFPECWTRNASAILYS